MHRARGQVAAHLVGDAAGLGPPSVTMTAPGGVAAARRLSSDPGLKYVSDGTRNHCGGVCRRDTVLMFRRLR